MYSSFARTTNSFMVIFCFTMQLSFEMVAINMHLYKKEKKRETETVNKVQLQIVKFIFGENMAKLYFLKYFT